MFLNPVILSGMNYYNLYVTATTYVLLAIELSHHFSLCLAVNQQKAG